jgi:HD superfamily phosphodiesterase
VKRVPLSSIQPSISTEAEKFFARYGYPDWLRAHSLLVGRIAETLVFAHGNLGAKSLDVALGGYLHDIGRSPLVAGDPREHNELSAMILAAEGLGGAVEPARRHSIYTVLDPANAPATLADKIVYVADRRGGMRVESVEVRARDAARWHPRFAADIERAIPIAKALEREVFAGLPFAPEELEAHLIT